MKAAHVFSQSVHSPDFCRLHYAISYQAALQLGPDRRRASVTLLEMRMGVAVIYLAGYALQTVFYLFHKRDDFLIISDQNPTLSLFAISIFDNSGCFFSISSIIALSFPSLVQIQ